MAGADREEVVRPEMKVAEVLKRWPHLLEVLVEASPAFQKLKNPSSAAPCPTWSPWPRRRGSEAWSRRSSWPGSTGPWGWRPGPRGQGGGEPPRHPAPPWLSAPVGFRLDVRPTLEAGGEPFQAIMAAAKEVKPGERLVLEVLFEPVPLYRVLAKQGFLAWCEKVGERHYRAHFYRQEVGEGRKGERDHAAPSPRRTGRTSRPRSSLRRTSSLLCP
ncbi:DUF2249 domain-containing protein [Thermus parvatiensis]|uniref:DUF2249 domain-containing protein n=1 Tax=Thermus parvatiensis TaxID=456163 RepID=UPI000A7E5C2B|nr:DUF2249 domain-containing protein [Thermus parvatiensis]